MVRLGWGLIVVGLMAAAWVVFQFYLVMVVDPTGNDPIGGLLMVSGLGAGVSVAVAGVVLVVWARGRRAPPP